MEAAFRILTNPNPLSAATRCVENAKTPIRRDVFAAAWHELLKRYLVRTPTASRAIAHLDGLGARVHNDHIALRSFVDSGGHSGLAYLDRVFTAFGYAAQDDIVIPSLPVNARWYEPPAETDWPKVFVSELRTGELPAEAAKIVFSHVDGFYGGRGVPTLRDALAAASGAPLADLLDEPPWRPTAAEVAAVRGADGGDAALRGATEYASWTLTHGHRINHLTILHNALGLEAAVPTLAALNARMIADLGFEFNKAGGSDGLTQGSVASRLEQSSTVADHIEVTFGCGKEERLPCAFLELIQRHDGFRGFLGQNAKGIFASTHAGRS